jgi:hypothetical protein
MRQTTKITVARVRALRRVMTPAAIRSGTSGGIPGSKPRAIGY